MHRSEQIYAAIIENRQQEMEMEKDSVAQEIEEARLQQEEAVKASEAKAAQAAAPASEKPVAKRKIKMTSLVAIALILCVVFLGVFNTLISVVMYNPVRGVANAPFAGLRNYEAVLGTNAFSVSIENSLIIHGLQLVLALLLALPVMAGIGLAKKPGKVLTLAALCLLPVCLPGISVAQALQALLPMTIKANADAGALVVALVGVLQKAGFIAFCGGLFVYLHRRGIGKGGFQGLRVGLLISMISFLTGDLGDTMLMGNAMNRQSTQTLDYFFYQYGLQNAQFARSAAASVAQVVLQMVVAILPAIFLCKAAKPDHDRVALPDAKKASFTLTAGKMFWIAALLVVTVASFGVSAFMNDPQASLEAMVQAAATPSVTHSLLISVCIAALGGVAAGFAAYSFIRYFGQGGKGFGLAMILMGAAVCSTIGKYMLVRNLGMINTVWGPVFAQMFDPRLVGLMIVLAIVMRMAPDRSHKGLFVSLSLLAAAFAWGDFVHGMVYVANSSLAPVTVQLYRAMYGMGSNLSTQVSQAMVLQQQAMKPMLSLLTALPALALGGLGAGFMIRAFSKAD